MKRLSKRETIILIICVALLVFFGFWNWVIKPILEGGTTLEDRLRVTQSKLAKAQAVAADAKTIGKAATEGVEMSEIISTLETAARQSGIHIANMQPQRSNVKDGVRFFSVELQVDGQWPALAQFLYLIQQKPNFYFVDEVTLEKFSDVLGSLRGRMVVSRLRLNGSN